MKLSPKDSIKANKNSCLYHAPVRPGLFCGIGENIFVAVPYLISLACWLCCVCWNCRASPAGFDTSTGIAASLLLDSTRLVSNKTAGLENKAANPEEGEQSGQVPCSVDGDVYNPAVAVPADSSEYHLL